MSRWLAPFFLLSLLALTACDRPKHLLGCPPDQIVCRRKGTVPIRRTVCRCLAPVDVGAPEATGGNR